MELNLWTDGSSDTIITSSYVILTENNFIHRGIKTEQESDSLKAEVKSIIMGLRYINQMKDIEDYSRINVFTDLETAVKHFQNVTSGREKVHKLYPRKLWQELFHEVDKCKIPIEIIYYKSHQDEFNPNKLCDITCRIIKKYTA